MSYYIEKGDYSVNIFIFNYSKNNTLENFLTFLGIKEKSYFSYFFKRLYNALFVDTINLNKEYKKYYKKEYCTFKAFLTEKYNLNDNEINLLKDNEIVLYKKFASSSDSIVNIMCDDSFFVEFKKYMEVIYENKS